MANYTGQSIPPHIEEMLKEYIEVESLTDVDFSQTAVNINTKVSNLYHDNPSKYKKYFTPDDKEMFISGESLKKYFSRKGPIRTDKLYVLLCYMDIEPNNFINTVNNKLPKEIFYSNFLNGPWIIYSLDRVQRKVKATPLLLVKTKSDYVLYVHFKTASEDVLNGKATISGNTLNIEGSSHENQILGCAELPEKGSLASRGRFMLNVAVITRNNGVFETGYVVIVKNNKFKINPDLLEDYLNTETLTIPYKPYSESKPSANKVVKSKTQYTTSQIKSAFDKLITNEECNQILQFLFQSQSNILEPFSLGFEDVKRINNKTDREHGTENYDRLKIKLHISGNEQFAYFSFNRFRPNGVAVFNYSFSFHDEERVCIATRHRIGAPLRIEFQGFVTLEGEKVYMQLYDNNQQRRKLYIAPFTNEFEKSENDDKGNNSNIEEGVNKDQNEIKAQQEIELKKVLFRGITCSISSIDGHHMALREIIVLARKKDVPFDDSDKVRSYISYKKFLNLPEEVLSEVDKLYIANQLQSTLTYPSETNAKFSFSRQDKARKYNGVYQVFTKNHEKSDEYILRSIMDIDKLSQVILSVKYDNDSASNSYIYHGICEFYNCNLRVGTHLAAAHPSEQKHYEFIFDPAMETYRNPPNVFTGICINTSEDNLSWFSRFFAIRSSSFEKTTLAFASNPGIISKSSEEYKNLDLFFNKEFKERNLNSFLFDE